MRPVGRTGGDDHVGLHACDEGPGTPGRAEDPAAPFIRQQHEREGLSPQHRSPSRTLRSCAPRIRVHSLRRGKRAHEAGIALQPLAHGPTGGAGLDRYAVGRPCRARGRGSQHPYLPAEGSEVSRETGPAHAPDGVGGRKVVTEDEEPSRGGWKGGGCRASWRGSVGYLAGQQVVGHRVAERRPQERDQPAGSSMAQLPAMLW